MEISTGKLNIDSIAEMDKESGIIVIDKRHKAHSQRNSEENVISEIPDEDTDDASEIGEGDEIKVNNCDYRTPIILRLKKELEGLEKGTNKEYNRRLKKLLDETEERLVVSKIFREYESSFCENISENERLLGRNCYEIEKAALQHEVVEKVVKEKETEEKKYYSDTCGGTSEKVSAAFKNLRSGPFEDYGLQITATVNNSAIKRATPKRPEAKLLLTKDQINNDVQAMRTAVNEKLAKDRESRGIRPQKKIFRSRISEKGGFLIQAKRKNNSILIAHIKNEKLFYENEIFQVNDKVEFYKGNKPGRIGNICAINKKVIYFKTKESSAIIKITLASLNKKKVVIKRHINID